MKVSTNLEYRPNYGSIYRKGTEVTIPKAKRDICSWVQEAEEGSRVGGGPGDFFSISASMKGVSEKIGDFSKMGSRTRPSAYLPVNLDQSGANKWKRLKKKPKLLYRRRLGGSMVDVEKIMEDSIRYIND